jgi:PadR family transcriptional regulator AphA
MADIDADTNQRHQTSQAVRLYSQRDDRFPAYSQRTAMSRNSSLTTTSYAILGLLAAGPRSPYQLAQEMDRNLRRIWPRARSKLYEEPKKLVRHGLATATSQLVGRRPRTVYTITPTGRRALTDWLHEPGAGPVLESEQLLKILFAQSGTSTDTLATLHAARTWAAEHTREHLIDNSAHPNHTALTMLIDRFLIEHYRLVATWADWAAQIVEQWPDDPHEATPDQNETTETLRLAHWSTTSKPSAQ